MIRVERRRLRFQLVVGTLLTIIVVFADLGGSLHLAHGESGARVDIELPAQAS